MKRCFKPAGVQHPSWNIRGTQIDSGWEHLNSLSLLLVAAAAAGLHQVQTLRRGMRIPSNAGHDGLTS